MIAWMVKGVGCCEAGSVRTALQEFGAQAKTVKSSSTRNRHSNVHVNTHADQGQNVDKLFVFQSNLLPLPRRIFMTALIALGSVEPYVPETAFGQWFLQTSILTIHMLDRVLNDLKQAMREFFRALKPGGVSLFAESTRRYIHCREELGVMERWLRLKPLAEREETLINLVMSKPYA